MPREAACIVETQEGGKTWRRHWQGTGEPVALDLARTLHGETWPIKTIGGGTIPRYTRVRVRRGKTILLDLGPQREA